MFVLCDCDNFYASCERVFNPALIGRPVVILSNNDGCVVARSREAKALGIGMGVPFFKVRDFLESHDVAVFSSNYTLYGDMSRRVMMLLSEYSPDFYQYSIDEMFLDMGDGYAPGEVRELAREARRRVGRGTGIPITAGIAVTKTLAKVAARYGKDFPGYGGVCMIETEEQREKALLGMDISKVWGIGRRMAEGLRSRGVKTAFDFTMMNAATVRRLFTVTGLRTWRELRGESCIELDKLPESRSISSSRSVASPGIVSLREAEELLSALVGMALRKLCNADMRCGEMTFYAVTNRFRADLPQRTIWQRIPFSVPTNDVLEITSGALSALRREWGPEGYVYKKMGVVLDNLSPADNYQTDLFDNIDRGARSRLMDAIRRVNGRCGRDMVRPAVRGGGAVVRRDHLSPDYTTDIDDILVVGSRDVDV